MVSNRLAFAGLGFACVLAAGGGGYLATRQSAVVAPASASAVEPRPVQAVQQTEAAIAPVGPVAPAAAAVPPPIRQTPVPRAEARRNEPRPPARSSAPPLDRTWPTGAGAPADVSPPPVAAPAPVIASTAPAIVETPAPAEPARAPEPPEKLFSELVVSAESVIGLQNETALNSERARVEDRVEARVVRDVRVGGDVAIPAGSKALGSVMVVDRGGRFKERARLGIRFHTLVLADGTRLPVSTETIYRYGDEPGNKSAAKVGGGAVAGAILGAIIGGAKGAAVGATAGAGGGTAAVMASDRSMAVLPVGAEVTARIVSPVTVTIEK